MNKKNKGNIKAQKKRWQKRSVSQLRDTYIKISIKNKYGINFEDITKKMIQWERERLIIKRLFIKKGKNENSKSPHGTRIKRTN